MNTVQSNNRNIDPEMAQMAADSERAHNHLRKSASSADYSGLTRPREIEVHIEELVLHGFSPHDGWRIGDALEQELRGLLSAKGVPPAWLSSPERVKAETIRLSLTRPAATGAGIAAAVYKGEPAR